MADHLGFYSRGYLPHLDLPRTVQTVRFHVIGAVPDHVRRSRRHDELRFDRQLDRSTTRTLSCAERDLFEANLLHFDGLRYDLVAWSVMPNHVHVCFVQRESWCLAKIVAQWKGYSAKVINEQRGERGAVWSRDYFDKAVRTDVQLRNTILYIEGNPVKAGLVACPAHWRWSSAWNARTKWPTFEPS